MSNATRNDEGFSAKRTAEIVGITHTNGQPALAYFGRRFHELGE